jgi:PAS domain S-box-containing protein
MSINQKLYKSRLPVLQTNNISPEIEAIFEAMEDGVCVQSPDSRILRVNSAFVAMMGLPLENIIGHTCEEVFGCLNDTDNTPRICARIASSRSQSYVSEELRGRKPGQRLRARVSPIYDESGNITAYVMVVRDITDLLRRERELARAQQLALIGELAAGLAHEIKNPLAGIKGAMDILIQRRSQNDPEYSVLDNVRQEVNRIDSSVHSLLRRTRPRSIKLAEASLVKIVYNAVMLARDQIASADKNSNQIKIIYHPHDSPLNVLVDAPQIEDAVLNLIINAIEAIEGEGSIIVELHREENNSPNGEAVIIVKDNGRGIPAQNMKSIFSPFFTTKENGTGLGLAAVWRIMRIHSGRVEASSNIGEGSTFKLRIPIV